MITFGRFVELGKTFGILTPIEPTAINNNTPNRRAMSAYPFRSRVADNVNTMIERPAEIPSSAERIVDLEQVRGDSAI